eukprot:c28652_g1_i1 orf=3-170(-)
MVKKSGKAKATFQLRHTRKALILLRVKNMKTSSETLNFLGCYLGVWIQGCTCELPG